MKNSSGELSIVVVTLLAVTLVSSVVTTLVSNGNNLISSAWNKILGKDESNNSSSNNGEIDGNFVYLSVKNNSNSSDSKVIKLFNDNVNLDGSFDIDDKIKSKLKNLTDSNIKKISKNKIECSNNCSNIGKAVDYDYYKVNNNYVTIVTDNNGSSYTFNYAIEKNFFGSEKYSYTGSSNNSKAISLDKESNNNLSSEEVNGNFSIDSDYNDSFVSMASASKINETMSSNSDKVNKIYEENISSIVLLNAYNKDVIVNKGTGFFLMPGIIVTSWNYLSKSLEKGNNITAITANNKNYNIDGIISVNEDADVALLKLNSEVGSKVSLGSIDSGEEVLLLGTFSGFGLSGKIGFNLDNSLNQVNSLYVQEENIGSPLFNKNGEVVGIVTSKSNDKVLSNSTSSKVLDNYVNIYNKVNFKNIKSYSIDSVLDKFYKYKVKKENISNTINSSLWNKYKKIGNIEKNIKLELVKGKSFDNKISLRYINNSNVDNDVVISEFISALKKSGYKTKLDTNKKKIFVSDKIITIYYEFDYIIIIMEDR